MVQSPNIPPPTTIKPFFLFNEDHSLSWWLLNSVSSPPVLSFLEQCWPPMFSRLLAFGFCWAGAGHRIPCYWTRKPCELGPHLKQEKGQGRGWGRAITFCQVEKDQIINRKNIFNFPQGQCFVNIVFTLFSSKDDFGGLLKQAAVNQLFEGPCVFMAHFSFKHWTN